MADPVVITSPKELEQWLSDKPRAWTVAISARAALRVMPIFADMCIDENNLLRVPDITLTVFNAVFLIWANAKGLGFDTTSTRAGEMIDSELGGYSDTAAATAKFAIADAAAAVRAAISGRHHYAVSASARAYSTDSAIAWAVVSNELSLLTKHQAGDPAQALLRAPLWLDSKTPASAEEGWRKLQQDSSLVYAGFSVWFDWYNSLINSSNKYTDKYFDGEFISWLAGRPDDWWHRGRRKVNIEIASRLLGEHVLEEVPPQVTAAFRFQQVDERIGVAPLGVAANDLAAAQTFLDELRKRVAQLAERLESARNAVPFLADEVERLRDFLPAGASELNPYLLHCRLISIDGAVMTFQTAGAARELADDPTLQVTGLALIGRELLLCFPDLRTREREEIGRQVAGREAAVAAGLDIVLVAAQNAGEAVDPAAQQALETVTRMDREVAEAPGDKLPEVRRERLVERALVKRNFLAAVAKAAQRLAEGTWDRLPDHDDPAIRGTFAFGLGALISKYLSKNHGEAYTLASYGRIDDALKLLAPRLAEKGNPPKVDGKE